MITPVPDLNAYLAGLAREDRISHDPHLVLSDVSYQFELAGLGWFWVCTDLPAFPDPDPGQPITLDRVLPLVLDNTRLERARWRSGLRLMMTFGQAVTETFRRLKRHPRYNEWLNGAGSAFKGDPFADYLWTGRDLSLHRGTHGYELVDYIEVQRANHDPALLQPSGSLLLHLDPGDGNRLRFEVRQQGQFYIDRLALAIDSAWSIFAPEFAHNRFGAVREASLLQLAVAEEGPQLFRIEPDSR